MGARAGKRPGPQRPELRIDYATQGCSTLRYAYLALGLGLAGELGNPPVLNNSIHWGAQVPRLGYSSTFVSWIWRQAGLARAIAQPWNT